MAVQEQVERLTRSVDEWNEWRREHPEIRPDLSEADLRGDNLSNANLGEAYFRGSGLSYVNFSYTDLSSSNLSSANLSGADLSNANLSNANLSGANLGDANLDGDRLKGADLTKAHFYHTTFAWVDLTLVKGLEMVIHDGPSTVNVNSVVLPTEEHIHKHFLRGVGFSETQIEYLPSLLKPRPIQYYSIFISYAHQDEVLAQQLHTNLRNKDVPCWFAPEDLKIGNKFRQHIDKAIHLQDKLLLLLSEYSIASTWVENEVEAALEKEDRQQREVLFPVRLDDAMMQTSRAWAATLRRTRYIGDFTNWTDPQVYQRAFDRLLWDLKRN